MWRQEHKKWPDKINEVVHGISADGGGIIIPFPP
jgi:hypothetical protein